MKYTFYLISLTIYLLINHILIDFIFITIHSSTFVQFLSNSEYIYIYIYIYMGRGLPYNNKINEMPLNAENGTERKRSC